ncbi:hypothetical protein PIB30_027749 [Stylosanthes scabra]|uniref:Transmembrane protein n=1 Tax=Stylosanthes scabra TaxID=79078 RepID=A0ABU6X9M1_9FABA|nr:hypothetical protein [Stylosanthes scabra]
MEVSTKILRTSIHTFLQNYHYFTSTPAILAIPFSASILISQALLSSSSYSSSSSIMPHIFNHLKTLFSAAGFPSTSQFFSILNLKVSQTITCSILTLPFTLTFLLIAKASVIQALSNNQKPVITIPPSFTSIFSHYNQLFHTYLHNSFFILSANATSFCLLFLAFAIAEGLGYSSSPGCSTLLSAAGAILFSVILANALVICNMALTLSAMEGKGGYMAILKACVLLRGRTSMALFLALPANAGLAAIEALFQLRIVRTYDNGGKMRPWMVSEGILIAYLHSIFIILDSIVSFMFYKSCKIAEASLVDSEDDNLLTAEFTGYLGTKHFDELP